MLFRHDTVGVPVEEIRPGDVIWFPKRPRRWHGRISPQEALNGKTVEWMEKVSDEQYLT
jgi:hypothetical protein